MFFLLSTTLIGLMCGHPVTGLGVGLGMRIAAELITD